MPEPVDLDFGEFNASVGAKLGRASARLGLYYSPDFYLGGSSRYEYLSGSVSLIQFAGMDVGVSGQIGASQFSVGSLRSYMDWKLGLRASRGRWYGSAAFSKARPAPALVGGGDAGTRFSATLGCSF